MASTHSKRQKKPVDIRLTMRVKFGKAEDDVITVVDDRRLKLIGNAFQYRDRAIKFFVYQILRAGTRKPRVYGHFAPAARGLMRVFTNKLQITDDD